MKFDWYEATIEAQPEEVVGALLHGLGDGLGQVNPKKGTTYGYERAYDVAIGDQVLASVFYGGGSQGSGVHGLASGANAPAFAALCRDRWSVCHKVTRLDVAEDYHGADAFTKLSDVCIKIAQEHRLRTFTVGDWVQGHQGRTLYVGSPTSAVRVRCYEKGKEYRERGITNVPLDWTRVELVARPKGDGRRSLASSLPVDCFRLALWSRHLYALLFGLELPKLADVSWTATDDDRAYRFLLRQYGPLLGRLKEREGSWSAVGELLGEDIAGGKAPCR